MPSSHKRIRKPAYELTIADLEQFPLWETCLDEEGLPGQDESTMRPLKPRGPVSYPAFYGWVTADFTTHSGMKLIGVIEPCESPAVLWNCSPEIFLKEPPGKHISDPLLRRYNSIITSDRARIGLTLGAKKHVPDTEARPLIQLAYKALGLRRGDLFPMLAKPRVPIREWPDRIRIEGFLRAPDESGRSSVLV